MSIPQHFRRLGAVLLAVAVFPVHAASTCAGFIPSTIVTFAQLVTAVNQAQSANCPGADVIDLAGAAITFTSAGFTYDGEGVALPVITTPITITDGTLTRSSAAGFKFLAVTAGSLSLSNMALSNGGGSGIGLGGAVHAALSGQLNIVNGTFLNNGSPGYAGGAVFANGSPVITVRDSLFRGNQSGLGGAILVQASTSLTIDRSTFEGNIATEGGAIHVDFGGPGITVRDTLFVGNAASNGGSALSTWRADTIINSTFAGNFGSALQLRENTAVFRNSVVWGNGSSLSGEGGPAVVTRTAMQGYAGATINTDHAAEDFFVNPLLAPTGANTGLNYNPALYDWTLRPFSPAIDAADNAYASTTDRAGATRRVDDVVAPNTGVGTAPIVDMGAYERQATSCSVAYPYTLAGPNNAVRRLNLRDAVRCANINGASADTIDLDGQTVTFANAFANATALPQVTTAIHLRNGTIERSTAGGTPNFRLLYNVAGSLALTNMTLRNGDIGDVPGDRGGAIFNIGTLSIDNSTLSNNNGDQGGALLNDTVGVVTISRSTLEGNRSRRFGSVAVNYGALTLSNSTVTGNTVADTTAGIATGTILSPGGSVTLLNTTVSGNTNPGSEAAAVASSGSLTLRNTILANNTPLDCARQAGATAFSPGTSNIIEAQSPAQPCGAVGTSHLALDPQLGSLTGSPAHFPLTATSPAVNAGDNASVAGITLDQPGNARIQQGIVDLGSVESGFLPPQVVTVQFNAGTSSASEAAGFGNLLRVNTSNGNPTEATTIALVNVTGGTATAADYNLTGTITVPAGTANNALVSIAGGVTLINETLVEPNETLQLSLTAPIGATLGTQVSTTHTINNDDTATVTVADVAQAEGDSGTSLMTFTVTVDNPVQGGFALDYTTSPLTAGADVDYVTGASTLTFVGAAGEMQSFAVTINGDTAVEADETFRVSFPSALATVAPGSLIITDVAVGTITNDDGAALTMSDVRQVEGNAGTSVMIFTATLGNPVQGGFTVNYATADGTATAADADYVADSGTLTFAGTAGESETFTVTVNGDIKVEANETFTVSLDSVSNPGVDITGTATGTIDNDDTAAVIIADVSQPENGSFTFTASLSNATAAPFSVDWTFAPGTTNAEDYVGGVLPTGGTLSFSGTINETHTFTVPVLDDGVAEPAETFTIGMANFVTADGLVVDIADIATGTIIDNDVASYIVDSSQVTDIAEPDTATSFTIRLGSVASGTVILDIGSTDPSECVASPASVTFNTGNSNAAQTITITAVDDLVADGTQPCAATITRTGGTAVEYGAVANPANIDMAVDDDDVPGVSVMPTAIAATEGGTDGSYTVVLDSQPSGNVSIAFSGDGQVSTTPATLQFTAADWDVAQTVTVTAVDDAVAEGNHAGAITHLASGADYNGVAVAGVTVDITDNDANAIVVTPTDGLVTTEAGGTATFTVVLGSEPTADVTIALSSSDSGEGTVAPAALVFDATNWNTAQTVTVTGVDDTVVDGDVFYTIVTAAAVSSDPVYGGVDAADVSVTNTDDDATARLSATKRISQIGTATQPVVYEIVVTNDGSADQPDAAGSDELVDVLPAGLALASASATSGSLVADIAGNTVRWNGALPIGAAVTLQITADVTATDAGPISNQAIAHYDSDGDGNNDATALSDDPSTPGSDATVFAFEGIVTPPPSSLEPTVIPTLDLRMLLALMLCIGVLGGGAMRRRGL